VEERPFQGRVTIEAKMGFSPGGRLGSRLELRPVSKASRRGAEVPLFHGTAGALSRASVSAVPARQFILGGATPLRDGCHIPIGFSDGRIRKMHSQRTFFVTTVTWQRRPIFSDEAKATLLLDVFLHYRDQGEYLLHEFVIMPDHLHLLITPAADVSLEKAMQFIKGNFAFRLGKKVKMKVWQESFTNHRVRDAEDYEHHRSYIQLNPVRAGLMINPYSAAPASFRLDEVPPGLKPTSVAL
jgi:putative transposase